MKKSLSYGFKAIRLVWEANGIYSVVMILGKIYESTLYPFIQVFLLAQILDLIPNIKDLQTSSFVWIIVTYLVASFIKLALRSYLDMKEAYFQTELEGFIDLRISKKLTELDPATFEDPEFQNLLSQLEGVKGTLQMHVLRSISLIDAVFKFITATIVVSTSFPLFAPIIVITTIPLYLAVDKARVVTWPYFVEKRSLVTRVTQYIKTLLSSDSTSKESIIYKTGDTLLSKIKDEQKKYYKDFSNVVSPWPFRIFLGRMVQFLAFIYTQYFNIAKIFEGNLTIGQFALLFQQSQNLVFSAEEILSQYSSMSARNKYLDKFFDFLERKSEIVNPANPKLIPNTTIPQVIEFKNVSFKYPRSERYILKDFNLTINSSERIALVGENGAGKTTIIKLLLRFYDVTEGEILINGVNIKEIDLSEWHKHIGALFQDFIKYQFKFSDNIYLGDLSKTDNEKLLREAISKSGADKYLDTLPSGINQVVGKMFEGGVDLSGGQWQKLALARAFFRDAPILILDEPTSAIDAKAEYEIFQNIQKLENDKTVIIISHRFSTVRHADRILVLDDGKIIEQGTHEELIALKGLYEELLKYKLKDINKTNKMKNNDNKETFNTPKEYIASLSDEKRKNMELLFNKISKAIPNEKPFMMSGIIGFGKYHFKYASGREGDWLTIGLKENKTGYSIYICSIDKVTKKYLIEMNSKKIGKASCGKSCIRFKKLEDIDLDFVLSLIKKGIKAPLLVDLNVKDRK